MLDKKICSYLQFVYRSYVKKAMENYNLPSRNPLYDLLFDDKGHLTNFGVVVFLYYGLALFVVLMEMIFKHD